MSTKISDYISALDLGSDATYRGDCPVCHGKNTFTVTNDRGNVLYNCYKNSCKIAGAVHTNMDAFTIKSIMDNRNGNASESYTEALHEEFVKPPYLTYLTQDDSSVNMFVSKWNLDPDDLLYDIRQSRVVFPVYTENALLVDAVGRSLTGRKPKWLRYNNSPFPYIKGSGTVGVIVEDAISAYTVGRVFSNVTGIALLGTQLTDFHRYYLPKWYDTLIVALDPDARDKSIKIARELNGRALNLRDDLKYALPEDIENLSNMLREVTTHDNEESETTISVD